MVAAQGRAHGPSLRTAVLKAQGAIKGQWMQGLGIGCGLGSTVLIQSPGEELPCAWLRERPLQKAEELHCLCASHTSHTTTTHTHAQWLSEAGLLAGWPATRP